jgi:hypothetical protein
MWRDLGTLFWLQWLLTRSMFRTRRVGDRLQAVRLLSRGLVVVFTLPLFASLGVALALLLAALPPGAAGELAMVINVLLFAVWLLLPASYNSQLVERFEMSRLFAHPIRFVTIVTGTTLMSMLTVTGMWTVPLLAGEIAGLAWHRPLLLPLVALGALPVFALLVLTGRIMEDLFDLVAGDRRLRAVALALLSLPFLFCWLGQIVVQQAAERPGQLPPFLQVPELDELERLGEAESLAQFVNRVGVLLEAVQPSRWLVWTPPGWVTAGMTSILHARWWQAAAIYPGSLATVGLLLTLHAVVTGQLMAGAALRTGPERVRGRQPTLRLPGPAALWALLRKDWRYLRRSPVPRRVLFSSLMMVVAAALPLGGFRQRDVAQGYRDLAPLLAFLLAATLNSMSTNMTLTSNYFGTVDRDGFSSLALSPVDRRYVLASSTLTVSAFVLAVDLVLAVTISALSGRWAVLPLGMLYGLCAQLSISPLCSLVAILAPFRAELRFSTGHRRGNLWGMLAWAISAAPVLVMVVLPYLFWRQGWLLTLPLAVLYSVLLYALTLRPLSRLLARHEHAILEVVSAGPS